MLSSGLAMAVTYYLPRRPGQRRRQSSRQLGRFGSREAPAPLPGPGHQRPNGADDNDLCDYIRRPRPEQAQERPMDGFPVEEAVVTSRDCVEGEGESPPGQRRGDRETVAAPIRPHAVAPGPIDGSPHDQQV